MSSVGQNPKSLLNPEASTLRTVISFLIFLHLFAVFVAVSSNFRPASPMRDQLRNVPGMRQYLQLLFMDLAYNFNLTYGELIDVDHIVELDTESKDGSFQTISATLPPTDMGNGIRRRRLQQLALNIAQNLEADEAASVVAKMLGGPMLDQVGAKEGHLRCEAQMLLAPEEVEMSDPRRNNPYDPSRYRMMYKARVWKDAYGNMQLFPLEKFEEEQGRAGAGATPAETAPPPQRDASGKPQKPARQPIAPPTTPFRPK